MTLAVPWALLLGAACGGSSRSIRVPEGVVKKPGEEAPTPPAAEPYVIKMTDGRRTWQIEIPAGPGAPAFEAAIPLELGEDPTAGPGPPATEADREIVDAKRARGETVKAPSPERDARPPSYLRTLDRVRALFRERRYELALVELVRLERVFPDDVRILEMKGTLLARLGRAAEARAAWERVLALDPENAAVIRALDALGGG
jgi:hypothetical protein